MNGQKIQRLIDESVISSIQPYAIRQPYAIWNGISLSENEYNKLQSDLNEMEIRLSEKSIIPTGYVKQTCLDGVFGLYDTAELPRKNKWWNKVDLSQTINKNA